MIAWRRKSAPGEVVVLGGNDDQEMRRGGTIYRRGTDAWQTEYARRVAVVMKAMVDADAAAKKRDAAIDEMLARPVAAAPVASPPALIDRTPAVDVPQSDVAPLQSVIQHTAAVNAGNSGGPLFNEFGEQIGINSAGGGGEDLNYSITTDRMLSLVDKMKEGYSPAWIGANFEVVLNDQGQPLGLQISNLAPFGPADRANMLPGQVIVGVNRRNTVTFKQFCRNMPAEPGTRVRLSVFDPGSGKVVAISLRPGTRR